MEKKINMNFQDFFNPDRVVDLSFFNFENAITACYYADKNLRVKKSIKTSRGFFLFWANVKDIFSRHFEAACDRRTDTTF